MQIIFQCLFESIRIQLLQLHLLNLLIRLRRRTNRLLNLISVPYLGRLQKLILITLKVRGLQTLMLIYQTLLIDVVELFGEFKFNVWLFQFKQLLLLLIEWHHFSLDLLFVDAQTWTMRLHFNDFSIFMDNASVKVHLVRSGSFKFSDLLLLTLENSFHEGSAPESHLVSTNAMHGVEIWELWSLNDGLSLVFVLPLFSYVAVILKSCWLTIVIIP
jgi:hypothetical protein